MFWGFLPDVLGGSVPDHAPATPNGPGVPEAPEVAARRRFERAAIKAANVLPGPVGQLVKNELLFIGNNSWLRDQDKGFSARLVEQVEGLPEEKVWEVEE